MCPGFVGAVMYFIPRDLMLFWGGLGNKKNMGDYFVPCLSLPAGVTLITQTQRVLLKNVKWYFWNKYKY